MPIFRGHALSVIRIFMIHFFLLALTQCLMSSWQNHNSYSTLLVEHNSSNHVYIDAKLSCLYISTLALHKAHVLTYVAQHLLAWLVEGECYLVSRERWDITCELWKRQNIINKPLNIIKPWYFGMKNNNYRVIERHWSL